MKKFSEFLQIKADAENEFSMTMALEKKVSTLKKIDTIDFLLRFYWDNLSISSLKNVCVRAVAFWAAGRSHGFAGV